VTAGIDRRSVVLVCEGRTRNADRRVGFRGRE
jgi:hypothetical protein